MGIETAFLAIPFSYNYQIDFRQLERVYSVFQAGLAPTFNMESQIEEWKQRAEKFTVKDRKALSAAFNELDAHLTLRSYIASHSQTDADVAVYQAIRANHIAYSFLKQGLAVNGWC